MDILERLDPFSDAYNEIYKLRETVFRLNYKMTELQIAYNKLLKQNGGKTKGARLMKEVRKKLGLTQVEFAKKIKMSQAYVSEIENGKKTISDALYNKIVALQQKRMK